MSKQNIENKMSVCTVSQKPLSHNNVGKYKLTELFSRPLSPDGLVPVKLEQID